MKKPSVREIYAEELATFERHKADLLAAHRGKFALIVGKDLLGVYDTWDDAADDAYRRLGYVRILVKPIVEKEEPVYLPIAFDKLEAEG